MRKVDAKKVVLPHSQAKLDLYKKYLEHYLRVLSLASFCTKINLYDIFCGIGLYEDGNIGSPLIAADRIKATNVFLGKMAKPVKQISLTINDNQIDKIQLVEKLLESKKVKNCTYNYYNKDADDMLDIAIKEVNTFKDSERSLIFIDPYGYSDIHKNKIENLLKNKNTEIVLFLPVMQMYRFTSVALNDYERKCFINLRNFINAFFPANHIIHQDKIPNIFEYINEIKKALSFGGNFFTCSHYLERERGSYYALFYISPHIYGLDKMVETKWSADPIAGKGFNQEKFNPQGSLFVTEFKELDTRKQIDFLKKQILKELKDKQQLNNLEIYKLTLLNEFKPSHANGILKELLKSKRVKAYNPDNIPINGELGFGISYKDFSSKNVKIIFKL
ncbi:MAG TPA: three-Cys-motif partner protein TcmP [Mucilaginibacter sp.]